MKKSDKICVSARTWERQDRRDYKPKPAGVFTALGLLAAAPGAMLGQEAVRWSLAGEAAAEERHRAASMPDDCHLRWGPTAWNFSAGLDLEANDNIDFKSSHPTADLTLRPQVTTRMLGQISPNNSVDFSLTTGYSAYVFHPEFNRLFIGPGSELSLDFYLGDLWLNVHERCSITENAYQDPTVVGTADYSQFQNTAGLLGTWDLNQLVLRLGYDHANYLTVSGGPGVPDGSSESAIFSAAHRLGDKNLAGIESGGGLINYSAGNAGFTQATDWNLGAFMEAQPLQYVTVKAAGGYTVYKPQNGSTQPPATEFTGAYARLALNHRLNQFVEYILSGGRNINFGFFGGTIDLYTAALTARWHLFRQLGLSTWFQFEHGSQALSGQEHFDRFGPGLSLDRPIMRKLTAGVRYQYYQRGSNMPGAGYVVNLVTMNLVFSL